jgi:hypothetical protein
LTRNPAGFLFVIFGGDFVSLDAADHAADYD